MNISEERLYEAAEAAAERWLSALPDRENCGHDFSPAFEAKMRPLLNHRRRRWKPLALLAAAVAALLVCGVYANRSPDYQVHASVQDGLASYVARPRDDVFFQTQELRQLTPGWLPDGFVLDRASTRKDGFLAFYSYDQDRCFALEQWCGGLHSGLLMGDYETEDVQINGESAILILEAGGSQSHLLWAAGPNAFFLSARGLSQQELLAIAQNLQW